MLTYSAIHDYNTMSIISTIVIINANGEFD